MCLESVIFLLTVEASENYCFDLEFSGGSWVEKVQIIFISWHAERDREICDGNFGP